MRIVVFGAGVVGTTTAFYLAERGHEVEVVDRGPGVASGASSANAGLLVPPDSVVWPSPRAPRLLLRAFGRNDGAISVSRRAGAGLLPWGAHFLRECAPARYRENTRHAHALSAFSYAELAALAVRLDISFEHQRNGMLFLYRRRNDLDAGLRARRPLAGAGERYIAIEPEEVALLDGAYRAAAARIAGVLFAPSAGHGDCVAFTTAVADRCRALGVTFSFEAVKAVDVRDGRVAGARLSSRTVDADAYVIALGAWSPSLAATAGVRLPIVPVRGFAATVPVVKDGAAPTIGGVDEDNHVAYSRMGQSLRLTTAAEFSGYGETSDVSSRAHLRAVGDSLFPGALDWTRAEYRSGLRPMTPAGLPRIGPTAVENLYVNSGHGHLGWTQACGSARLLAVSHAPRTGACPRAHPPSHRPPRRPVSNFILMLTRDDVTVADAHALLDDVLKTEVAHVGFKDVGLSPPEMQHLVDRLRDAGRTVHLEVVSLSRTDELESVRVALDLGVDYLIGGTHWRDAARLLGGSGIRYFPYPGRVLDHPARLEGSADEIVADAEASGASRSAPRRSTARWSPGPTCASRSPPCSRWSERPKPPRAQIMEAGRGGRDPCCARGRLARVRRRACSAIGAGNVHDGGFSENTGAAVALCATIDGPRLDPAALMPCHYHGLPDRYMFHTFTSGGIVLRWFRDHFCEAELANDGYERLSDLAASIPAGADGLVMLPHLQGAMAPENNDAARGALIGLTLGHGRGHVVRAIMEAIAFIVRRNVDVLRGLGVEIDSVRALGGGSRSAVWKQIEADVLRLPVVTMRQSDAGTLGAAILAGVGLGWWRDAAEGAARMVGEERLFEPDTRNGEIYEDRYRTYLDSYSALVPVFDRLAQ